VDVATGVILYNILESIQLPGEAVRSFNGCWVKLITPGEPLST
jgi:hypothetical protein